MSCTVPIDERLCGDTGSIHARSTRLNFGIDPHASVRPSNCCHSRLVELGRFEKRLYHDLESLLAAHAHNHPTPDISEEAPPNRSQPLVSKRPMSSNLSR